MNIKFNILSPREPFVDPATGIITPAWWRFLQQAFMLLGGYQGNTSVTDLLTLLFSEYGPSGPDYDRAIAEIGVMLAAVPDPAGQLAAIERRLADIETMLAAAADPSGQIAALERRVADLETQLATVGIVPDVSAILARLDRAETLVMGLQ